MWYCFMDKGKEYRLSKAKPNIHGREKEPETIDHVFKRAYYSLFECDLQDFSEQCDILAYNVPDGEEHLWKFAFFNLLSEMTSQDVSMASENGRRFHTKTSLSKIKKRSLTEIKNSHKALRLGMMLEQAGADQHGHFKRSCDIVRDELGVRENNDGYSDETLKNGWAKFKKIRNANRDLSEDR